MADLYACQLMQPYQMKHFDILNRFAKVFDLTYTRFNDLKKQKHRQEKQKLKLHWKE